MDIKPFLQSLFTSTLIELHSSSPDELQKEIAQGFLTYFGQFKEGDFYILDDQINRIFQLFPYDLSEELPISELEIESYLKYTRSINLTSHFTYNSIYVHPDNHWAIGGIYSIFKDILLGKVSEFVFLIQIDFTPSLDILYTVQTTITYTKEGLYLELKPEYKIQEFCKKYTGYYASEDGTIDAEVVINKFNLNFNLGNVIKYCIRAGKKDPSKHIEDLNKAKKYIEYEISRIIESSNS